MRSKKRWSDLTSAQRTGMIAAATVQFALAGAAWVDLARRPAAAVRGPKPVWALAIAVNWVGPIAYFTVGRRRGVTPELPSAQ